MAEGPDRPENWSITGLSTYLLKRLMRPSARVSRLHHAQTVSAISTAQTTTTTPRITSSVLAILRISNTSVLAEPFGIRVPRSLDARLDRPGGEATPRRLPG